MWVLGEGKLTDILTMEQLLRVADSWRKCKVQNVAFTLVCDYFLMRKGSKTLLCMFQ